jgi:hypothetical protein
MKAELSVAGTLSSIVVLFSIQVNDPAMKLVPAKIPSTARRDSISCPALISSTKSWHFENPLRFAARLVHPSFGVHSSLSSK